ncbi:MAG: hypothetical protein WD266_03940 [Balneolales bacterium]
MIGPGEVMVAVTAIVLGIGLTALFIIKIADLIKYWIDRRSGNKSSVAGRLSELETLSRRTEKRIQNLETIIVDNDMGLPSAQTGSPADLPDEKRPLQNKLRE